MTRRELLINGATLLGSSMASRTIRLATPAAGRRPLRVAVITDLHHGLAPDALSRLGAFCEAVKRRPDVDLVLQLGDFNYSLPESEECMKLFRDLPHRKLHVLGNHDMDKCDKASAMKFWGMRHRYEATPVGDYTFVTLDLNHFKQGGKLVPYANGNYFADGASCNWADPEQLTWLERVLSRSVKPVVLLSHQPLGFAEPNEPIPPEQREVLEVIRRAKAMNPAGAVVLSMFGHLHVDRLEHVDGVPFYCINSASYFWGGAMYPYSKPLFAFMEFTADGHLVVEGVSASFQKSPPNTSDAVIGRSASISNRSLNL